MISTVLSELIGQTNKGWTATEVFRTPKGLAVVASHPCGRTKRFYSRNDFWNNEQTCIKCRNVTTPLQSQHLIYTKNARKRNITFDLSVEDFEFLIRRDCFYCGSQPSQLVRGRWIDETEYPAFHRNGLDRLDSTKGYTLANSVTCCFPCNQMKGKMSSGGFIEHIQRIYLKFMTPEPLQ